MGKTKLQKKIKKVSSRRREMSKIDLEEVEQAIKDSKSFIIRGAVKIINLKK